MWLGTSGRAAKQADLQVEVPDGAVERRWRAASSRASSAGQPLHYQIFILENRLWLAPSAAARQSSTFDFRPPSLPFLSCLRPLCLCWSSSCCCCSSPSSLWSRLFPLSFLLFSPSLSPSLPRDLLLFSINPSTSRPAVIFAFRIPGSASAFCTAAPASGVPAVPFRPPPPRFSAPRFLLGRPPNYHHLPSLVLFPFLTSTTFTHLFSASTLIYRNLFPVLPVSISIFISLFLIYLFFPLLSLPLSPSSLRGFLARCN